MHRLRITIYGSGITKINPAKCMALLRSSLGDMSMAQVPKPKSPHKCEQMAASVVRIVPNDSHSG